MPRTLSKYAKVRLKTIRSIEINIVFDRCIRARLINSLFTTCNSINIIDCILYEYDIDDLINGFIQEEIILIICFLSVIFKTNQTPHSRCISHEVTARTLMSHVLNFEYTSYATQTSLHLCETSGSNVRHIAR